MKSQSLRPWAETTRRSPGAVCPALPMKFWPGYGPIKGRAMIPNEERANYTRFSTRNAVRTSLQDRPGGIRDSLRQGASQAAGAAPTLRYGPAGDSTPRLRLKAASMTERFPFGPASTARMPRFKAWCYAIERYQMRYKITD